MCSSCTGSYEDPDRTVQDIGPDDELSQVEDLEDLTKDQAQTVLTNAIRHLEAHNPDAVGMYAKKSWYAVDYADYSAAHILEACRELVIRT